MEYVVPLTAADAAIFETFVVPRYLSLYGELAMDMLLAGEGARIAHLGCRTGYPDRALVDRVQDASVVAREASGPALELARTKLATTGGAPVEYVGEDVVLDAEGFSHVLCLHPIATQKERLEIFKQAHELLYPGGQALFALPLRGSFLEVRDLLREYALKHDVGALGKAVEEMVARRPTIETLSEELEAVGLDDVDVEIRSTTLPFDSGRALAEDPVTRLMIMPELKAALEISDLDAALDYLREAVDKYWSELRFELTVNVGCASARRW